MPDIDKLKSIESNVDDAVNIFGPDITLGEAQSKLVDMLKNLGYYVYPDDAKKE